MKVARCDTSERLSRTSDDEQRKRKKKLFSSLTTKNEIHHHVVVFVSFISLYTIQWSNKVHVTFFLYHIQKAFSTSSSNYILHTSSYSCRLRSAFYWKSASFSSRHRRVSMPARSIPPSSSWCLTSPRLLPNNNFSLFLPSSRLSGWASVREGSKREIDDFFFLHRSSYTFFHHHTAPRASSYCFCLVEIE